MKKIGYFFFIHYLLLIIRIFTKKIKLNKGFYKFKFVVDGVWLYDNEAEKEADGMGSFNNFIEMR